MKTLIRIRRVLHIERENCCGHPVGGHWPWCKNA